jgi:CMP/dCMP kinase
MEKGQVITIDGPASAGKSTVGKILSKKLSYIYLDTGALYRAVAYKMVQEGNTTDDICKFSEFCRNIQIKLKKIKSSMRVILDNEDITDKIRTEEIGLLASRVSAFPCVRETLYHVQREAGREGSIIAEGRDMGTVIFPDAKIKFFLEASVKERAHRRYKELIIRGDKIDYQEVERDLIQRDKQDREREISPLIPSDHAVIIDSTNMTISDVVEKMISVIKSQS